MCTCAQCWVPAEFNEPWEEYSENYCWISNTYFLAVGKSLPEEAAQRYKNMIGYYQCAALLIFTILYYNEQHSQNFTRHARVGFEAPGGRAARYCDREHPLSLCRAAR